MKNVTLKWILGVCLGLCMLVLNLNAQDIATIKVLNVVGDVQSDGKKLTDGNKLKEGVTIKSAANSSCVLLFSNGSRIDIAEKTTLKVTQFTQEPYQASLGDYDKLAKDPSKSETKVGLDEGKLLFKVKKLSPVSKYDIGTPIGVAGIRSTEGSVTMSINGPKNLFKSAVTLSEGAVEFNYKDSSQKPAQIVAGKTLDVQGTSLNGVFRIESSAVRPATAGELSNASVGTVSASSAPGVTTGQTSAQTKTAQPPAQSTQAQQQPAATSTAGGGFSDYPSYYTKSSASLSSYNPSVQKFAGTTVCTSGSGTTTCSATSAPPPSGGGGGGGG